MRHEEIAAYIRRIIDDVDVKEVRSYGDVIVQLHHRPTGIRVEWVCGASRTQCYEEAFEELVDKMSEAENGRPSP
jgi:hypothetical protein